ncbi:L-seryl-tRNA(Sec) selenium transferase [Luteococcus sp. Sow4_B9]|uniref:L-seryl-tRNA(Sec) selenium transferase n=1 Tax=Luteococcus sp. Sow4_B9 TaxID=3438792 RepID=UPI003F9B798E
MTDEPRRRIPRTDDLLRSPELATAADNLGHDVVLSCIRRAQQQAREGHITPEQVAEAAVESLPRQASGLQPVINATGVVVHTNIGRAPLSIAARRAIEQASGYTDVELDMATGQRSRRGAGVLDALLQKVPTAEAAMVVNNGAAALVLATTMLAAGREVVVSRGELVEIGAGFRLPDLIRSTGARLHEVGTTNRTHLADYGDAIGSQTGCILKVHPSNFRVEGFTSAVDLPALAELGVPVVCDIGSGLLTHDPSLPDEPDAASALAAGADLVTASGDKLLGGPQAGIVLGRADLVERLRRHPLARAVRVDKLTLAALEATLRGPEAPVNRFRRLTPDDLRDRTRALADAIGGTVVETIGRVGGGGAPGHDLPGLGVALPGGDPDELARRLRTGRPAVLARVEDGHCLVDLRCVEADDDPTLTLAITRAMEVQA